MFDNITTQVNGYTIPEFLELYKSISNSELIEYGNKVYFDWGNLRVKYYPQSEILKVSNSIHKFYNEKIKGIGPFNYDDFYFTNVVETLNYISEVVKRPLIDFKLCGRFEYGLNINTGNLKPYQDIIERYQAIVTTVSNPFYVYDSGYQKPTSKFCSFTHYKVKFYDKGKESKLMGCNIMRYEIVHHSRVMLQQVLKKKDVSLADLIIKNNWHLLYEKLSKIFDNIRMLPPPTVDTDTYVKLLLYASPIVRKDHRSVIKKAAPKLKQLHDSLREQPDNPHGFIRDSILKKMDSLLTGKL